MDLLFFMVVIFLTELWSVLILFGGLLIKPTRGPSWALSNATCLIPEVHETLIVSSGRRPKLAILLHHYHLPIASHGLIKVFSTGTRVQGQEKRISRHICLWKWMICFYASYWAASRSCNTFDIFKASVLVLTHHICLHGHSQSEWKIITEDPMWLKKHISCWKQGVV